MAVFRVAQGMVSSIISSSGLSALTATTLPDEMVTIIEDVGLIESIPLWAVTLLGSLFIWVLALVMILTVYSRFFKLYIATAIAPVPLASFAGQPLQQYRHGLCQKLCRHLPGGAVSLYWPVSFSQHLLPRRLPLWTVPWLQPLSCGTMWVSWCSICWCWWGLSR